MASPDDGKIDQYGAGAYKDYRGGNTYEVETGVLVMPTCDGGGPVVVRTHDPYRVRRVAYGGVGLGRPQVFPRPADSDSVISFSHIQQLPIPNSSSAGGPFYTYPAMGGYVVLEDGIAPDYSEASYECPRFPIRAEPMASVADQAGYSYLRGETDEEQIDVRLTDPNWQWPQALTITSDFFSDQL